MSKLITHIKRLALALCFVTPLVSWAADKTNPVTGESETYSNVFSGEATEWNEDANWTPQGVPFVSGGTYSSALVSGGTVSTTTSIDGWNLQVGAYDGASITWSTLGKIQGDTGMWLTVDGTSSITIESWGGGNLGQDGKTLSYYVANEYGVTWKADLNSGWDQGLTMNYYLAGEGSVKYGALERATQVIKQADVTLSGKKYLAQKLLVYFDSTDKTFAADATIKIKDGDNVLKAVYLTDVTPSEPTITEDDDVGACELVQKENGVWLYYVDGDPADVVVDEKTYKPSININFTSGAAYGLTTSADVGLDGYAVPGTSWNNFVVANNTTYSTVNAIDSTGAASVASGVSVTVSGTRGSYYCSNLTPASNPLHGYIDEAAGYMTPTVTISGIPYEHYRVIVYHSTDSENKPFGYDTINGFDFTYVDGVQTSGTDSWGNSGADMSANAIEEGVNTLVSSVLSGDTVTMVAHRIGGDYPSARGCFAAIQVVEYVPEVGENDLEIAVDGATEYEVTEAKELSGTVYLTGSGTLTLTGSEKITAATIDVAKDVVLNINADRLDATTFTGAGTVVYDGAAPVAEKGWTAIGWSGTVWLKNQAISSFEGNQYGNAGSTIRFTGVTGFLQTNTYNSKGYVHTVPLELVDEGETIAFTYNNGWGGNLIKINTLKGTGTLQTQGSGAGEHIYIVDGSEFTGVFNLACKYVYVGGSQPDYSASTNPYGKLEIRSGVTMTVPSGKTWTANGGFVVDGTLNATGTLASSHASKAVSGSGTVVFGGVPSPTGDAWWKNDAWTGTVQVNGYNSMAGNIPFNSCGNAGSIVELKNVTGWINNNFTCTPKLKITGTLTLNNGSSNKANAFKVGTLLGDGCIYGDGSAPTVVFNVTTDWSGFTGTVALNNKCIVFGETIPDNLAQGTVYVSSGAVVTPQQASGTWWAVGGIKVDGELRAPNLDKFGGGTTITTTDNGIFTLTTSANTNDSTTDYARITGTGTLRYADASNIWRALSQNNFPTGMICENNLSEGLVLPTPNATHTIGSLAGSGKIRSDFSSGNRNLTILQAKDTTWSGLFGNDDRVGTVTVDSGASSTGTLTLSGIQTHDNSLTVNGSVNLTGTWKGATTVAGTFGGTGTLTGNLTFSAGSTFKAFASDEDGLAVSGTVTCPEEGTVTVDVSALTPETDVALLKAANLDATKFALAEGAPEGATLEVVEGVLTLVVPPATVDITITPVANATASVTVNGTPVTPVEGVVTVEIGATVVVTYTANDGYVVTGSPVEFTATAETTDVDTTNVKAKAHVAWIYDENGDLVGSPYTDELTAVQDFLQFSVGESVRFLAQSTYHDMLLNACTYDEETFTYTRKPAEPTVATITIGEKVYEYTSLAAAVAEGQNATIVLVDDIDLTGENENITIPATKSDAAFVTTLDLNGHSIAGDNDGDITVLGTLTLKDTAANSEGRIYSTTDYGTGHTTGLVLVQDSGVFNMQSGAIYAVRETPVDNGQYAIITKGNARVNISGGTITAGWYVVGANNLDGVALTVNITGGTLVSTTDYALYVVGNMAVTISDDAAVSGAAGMASVRKGSLTISGGTFATSGDGDVGSWTDGTATLNPTKALINLAADYAVSSVAISGGSFTAGAQADCIVVGAKAKAGSTASVTGGSFSSDPSAYVAVGYEATEDNGVWTVSAIPAYAVTLNKDEHITSLSVNPSSPVAKGATVVITVVVDDGFMVDEVEYVGITEDDVDVDEDEGTITFTMPNNAVTVSVTSKVAKTPVAPGGQTAPVETAEAAQAEAAKVVPSVPAAVAEALTTEQQTAYKALFEPKVVEVKVDETTTKYAVEVALTQAAETAIKGEIAPTELTTGTGEEEKPLDVASLATATDDTEVNVETKPGIYYGVKAGSSLGDLTVRSCKMATSNSDTVTFPKAASTDKAMFWVIFASPTLVPVEQE